MILTKLNRILCDPVAPLGGSPTMPQGTPAPLSTVAPSAPVYVPSASPNVNGGPDDVSMDDFLHAQGLPPETKSTPIKTEPVVKIEPAPATAPKIEPTAPEVKVPVTFDPTALVPPVVPVAPKLGERDYSLFTPEEAEAFKRTSNGAFERIATIYKEHKTLKDQLVVKDAELVTAKATPSVDALYQHERAYMLDDNYNQVQQLLPRASFEHSYWTKQLAALRAGQKPKTLTVNQQTGQYFEGQELPMDANTEALIMSNMNAASNWKNELSGVGQQIAATYAQQHKTAVSEIEASNAKFFPHLAKDDSPLRVKYKQAISDIHAILPPAFRANPLAKTVAYAYATLLEMGSQLKEAQAKLATNATTSVPITTQPPVSELNGIVPAGNNEDEDLMKQFEAINRRR